MKKNNEKDEEDDLVSILIDSYLISGILVGWFVVVFVFGIHFF